MKIPKNWLLFTLPWYSFCFLILVSWCYARCYAFFEYRTSSKTAFFTPKVARAPRVSLCFSMQSLLAGPPDYFFSDKEQSESDFVFINKTIGQLFDATPSINETIKSCSYRDLDANSLVSLKNSDECSSAYFNTTKYRMSGYMCYMFTPWKDEEYSLYAVNYAIDDNRVMFTLTMNDSLAVGHRICPLVHFNKSPYEDRNFNREILLPTNLTRILYLSYDLLVIKRLPPPYETRCGDEALVTCILKCSDQIHFKYSVVSAMGLSFSDHRQYILPGYRGSYAGRHINDMFSEALGECGAKKCQHEKCVHYLVRTIISPDYRALDDNKLTFIIKNAGHPPFMMKFIPKMYFVDLLTELTSLAGTICGFSALAALLIISRYKDYRKEHDQVDQLKLMAIEINSIFRETNLTKVTIVPKQDTSKPIKYRKLINLFIQILVITGFIIQVTNVSQMYFAYKVTIKIHYNFNPPVVHYPKSIFCFDLLRLLNGKRWPLTNGTNYYDKYLEKASLLNDTLDRLIAKTPPAHTIMSGCRLRRDGFNDLPLMIKYNASDCLQRFTFRRFYFNNNICYRVTLNSTIRASVTNGSVVQHLVTSNLAHPGTLYTIIFNDIFVATRKLEAILFFKDFDDEVNSFSVELYPTLDSHILGFISCHLLEYQLLPSPYETKCGRASSSDCQKQCLVKAAKKFNRLPRSSLFNETENLKLKTVNFDDLRDEKFYSQWTQIENDCHQKCAWDDCKDQKCIVYVQKSERTSEKLEVAVETFSSPIWYISSFAAFSLYNFIYNVQCCLSFWLGIEFIKMNPLGLIETWKNRRSHSTHPLAAVNIASVEKLITAINQTIDHVQGKLKREKKFLLSVREKFLASFNSRRRMIFICLLMIPFLAHLSQTIAYYLKYPTIMNLEVRTEEAKHLLEYEIAVCINLKEIILKGRNFTKSQRESVLHGKTIGQLFQLSPDKDEIITGCGFRALNGQGVIDRVSDRFFFTEINATRCRSILKSKRYLFKDFICYQYGQKASSDDGEDLPWYPLNERNLLLMVGLRSSSLTKEMSLSVGMMDTYPSMSGMWSPTAIRESTSSWYTITYSKYIQNILPPIYDQDGFDNDLYGLCCVSCFNEKLAPMGFSYSGLNEETQINRFNLSFVTKIERLNPVFMNKFRKIRKECRYTCATTSQFSFQPYFFYLSSEIADLGNQSFYQVKDSYTFYLQRSAYPVKIVSFRPEMSFFQFLIITGSIVSFWFGLTMNMISLPNHEETTTTKLTNKHVERLHCHLARTLNRLNTLRIIYLKKRRRRRNRIACQTCGTRM